MGGSGCTLIFCQRDTFSQLYLSVSQSPCDSETNQITKSYCHLTSMIILSDREVLFLNILKTFTLDVKSLLNENLHGILGDTQC
jgi:hypothetical protein